MKRAFHILLLAAVAAHLSTSALAETRARRTRAPRTAADTKAAAEPDKRAVLTADAGAVLSEAFENKARELLQRYIPLREFNVTVKVFPAGKPLPLTPYDPSGLILSRSSEELASYIQRVEIEVLLTSRLTSTRNRLQQMLLRELNLDARRGDRVRFGNLGIEIEPESWVQEKNELKTDMSRMRQENDRLSRELSRALDAARAAEQGQGYFGQYTIWVVIGGVATVFLSILIALFFAGRSMVAAGRTLATSFNVIATAVENVGGSIQAAAGISGGSGDQPKLLEGKLITDGGGGGKGTGLASLPMESLHAHFMKLRQELLDGMNENTEAVVIRHLTHLLSNTASVGRAVVTLELLGRDVATEMFKRLGVSSQEALLKFMREGGYEKSKIELMLEAGEELKTKLLVDSLDMARGRPSEKVAEKILQLTDEDLATLALEVNPDLLPRVFLYLDAPKITHMLTGLKNNNPKTYQKVLGLLSKMPEAERANHHDSEILRTIDTIINKTKSDAQRPFLKVYKEIIEVAEEDLGEEIVRELSADPRLDAFFRENVITIRTFFRLTDDARNEIIEGLSNKDVAALAYGVRNDERKMIMQSLPQRRKSMIAEEFESLSSRGGRQAQLAFKRVRDILVKKLTEMKDQGSLATVLRKDDKPALGKGGGGAGKSAPAFGGGRRTENTNFTNTGTVAGATRGAQTGAFGAGTAAGGTSPGAGNLKPLSPEGGTETAVKTARPEPPKAPPGPPGAGQKKTGT